MKDRNKPIPLIDDIIEAFKAFHWADRRQVTLWFKGREGNVKRINMLLRHLRNNKQKKLRFIRYENRYVYALPKKTKTFWGSLAKVAHGLACSECLVRILVSLRGEVLTEGHFYSFGLIPDFGLVYEDTVLLVEYSSSDQYHRKAIIKSKIAAYQRLMGKLEVRFGRRIIILFICDVDRSALRTDVGSLGGVPPRYLGTDSPSPFFFVDYKTFLGVPLGDALQSPIYIYVNSEVTSLV